MLVLVLVTAVTIPSGPIASGATPLAAGRATSPPGAASSEQPRDITIPAWPVLAGVALIAAQASLIGLLFLERRRRHNAQRSLSERVRFEQLLEDLSLTFQRLGPSEARAAIEPALTNVIAVLDVDRASISEFSVDGHHVRFTYRQQRPGVEPAPAFEPSRFPWSLARVLRGESVTFVRPDDLPTDAATDRRSFLSIGTRSLASVPLRGSGTVVGAVRVTTTRAEREWSPQFVEQLHLLAEIFSNAVAAARAAEAQREQEELFRAIADSAPVMIWMSGPDTTFNFLNQPWLDFTGRSLGDELGLGWIKGVHAADVAGCLDTYLAAFRERRTFRMEYRLRRRDGEYRWILDSGAARFTADGAFLGYVGSCVDVTELHQANDAMLESTALRSAILGSLYGRVATLDATGVIIAVNESWTAAVTEHGADPARTSVGANYLDVCGKASGDLDAQKALAAITAVLEGRMARASFEYACHGPTAQHWFEVAVEPLRRPEGGAVVSHIEITSRRRAEEESRLQRHELAHALRLTTLGQLVASMSHEMNQPLAAILSGAQAARRVLGTGEPGRDQVVQEALDYIVEDSKRAAQVIRRLRALFKKEHVERSAVRMNDIVMEAAGLVRGDAERHEVTIRFDLAERLPVVIADVIQLQQVVLNVVINGIEAMTAADEPREMLVTTVEQEPGLLTLSIRDTGVGVPPEQIEKIFEPFVTTKPEGLGMGLSISRSIVQAHGGRIWATANADRGLTVNAELPCEEPA
jgi:two-component system, LuxR family, sensor kinase FixL